MVHLEKKGDERSSRSSKSTGSRSSGRSTKTIAEIEDEIIAGSIPDSKDFGEIAASTVISSNWRGAPPMSPAQVIQIARAARELPKDKTDG